MFSLVSKLKLLKKPLRKLNFDQGNLFDNVKNLRNELSKIQASMVADPHSNELREAELACLKAYKKALKDEESFLRQKSKIIGLARAIEIPNIFIMWLKGELIEEEFLWWKT